MAKDIALKRGDKWLTASPLYSWTLMQANNSTMLGNWSLRFERYISSIYFWSNDSPGKQVGRGRCWQVIKREMKIWYEK